VSRRNKGLRAHRHQQHGAKPGPVWLFDLDNTLHDASHAAFSALNASMTAYIQNHLDMPHAQAEQLRQHYWQRYGATLLGLQRHHGIDAHHFLHHTHQLPSLESKLRMPSADRQALMHLPGRKLLLTNAPRAYALRVLRHLGMQHCFEAIIAIEDMRAFGHWRPKPDARMLKLLLRTHRIAPHQSILVDDSPANLRSARRLGMRTAWMHGYAKPVRKTVSTSAEVGIHLHGRPSWACAKITRLRPLHAWVKKHQ